TTGAAQALVRQQIPAVIAMQFEISDEAAASFAHGFYRAIAEALPVDVALVEARKAMFADGHLVEWGTSVLYTLSPDGHLFDVLPPAAPRPPPAPARESDYGAGPPAGNAASMAPPAPSGAPASPPMAAIAPAPLPSPPVPTPEQPSAGQRVSRAILPTVLLAATFLANLLETAMEQWWAKAAASVVNASAFHWLEREFVFDAHDVTNAIALYGYSSAYFFAFPLLGVLLAVALARRPGREPYLTFSLALTVAYVISLPFFLLFPVPERWAYPESGAILLSDRWSTALIEVFRPMSGLDNCFPSFHVTMSVVMIAVCHLYGVCFRTVVSAFCLLLFFPPLSSEFTGWRTSEREWHLGSSAWGSRAGLPGPGSNATKVAGRQPCRR
ncbi:MAG TPA: CHAT domain-containing protein, partial [Opitutaceae bacterium]